MDHGLELFIPILEILEIEVCNILYNPGNIGKRIFSIQSYPGNSGSYDPYISPILEILDRTIHTQSYPGNSGSYDPYSVLSWKYWIVRSIYQPYPGNIENLSLSNFLVSWKYWKSLLFYFLIS